MFVHFNLGILAHVNGFFTNLTLAMTGGMMFVLNNRCRSIPSESMPSV